MQETDLLRQLPTLQVQVLTASPSALAGVLLTMDHGDQTSLTLTWAPRPLFGVDRLKDIFVKAKGGMETYGRWLWCGATYAGGEKCILGWCFQLGIAHLGYKNSIWEGLIDKRTAFFYTAAFMGYGNDIPLALFIAGVARLTLGMAGERSLLHS